uniref:GDP-fucose protein O-fucosyltransferase 2 n=1 Tax=Romanomermis culicivorax TaxID=13658 RepID=A0A915HTI6_ROMCU
MAKDLTSEEMYTCEWRTLCEVFSKSLRSQIKIPWNLFFDLESLNRFVPVIEFDDYLKEVGVQRVEAVFYLQAYAESWTHWEEKWHYRPCIDQNYYFFDKNLQLYGGWFFGYEDIYAKRFNCISIQGHASMLKSIVLAENETAQSILFDRAETVLHDTFGDVTYWQARRSMRYNKRLVEIGNEFRRLELKSTDLDDKTFMQEDWTKDKITPGAAIGGPYLCVHWRRKDFIRAHTQEVPSIKGTAAQIIRLSNTISLNLVFLSTDALDYEVDELISYLPSNISIKRYVPSSEILQIYKDGGVSIIDQWICSHAGYFVGTHVSTFSFRIQEDREILGFNSQTTFNRLCPDNVTNCEQPSKWAIVL